MITHIYRVLHNACPLSKTVKWMVCAALFTIHYSPAAATCSMTSPTR